MLIVPIIPWPQNKWFVLILWPSEAPSPKPIKFSNEKVLDDYNLKLKTKWTA
jgi:hypothetical protein